MHSMSLPQRPHPNPPPQKNAKGLSIRTKKLITFNDNEIRFRPKLIRQIKV